jgi:hypothetical protein
MLILKEYLIVILVNGVMNDDIDRVTNDDPDGEMNDEQ